MSDQTPKAQGHPPFEVYIDRETVLRRVGEIARDLAGNLGPEGELPCLVGVAEGARPFARQLQQRFPGNPPVHWIRAKSYGDGTESSGSVTVVEVEQGGIPCGGREVVLIEDIVDTGRTIAALKQHFEAKGATGFRVATLLSKPARRVVEVDLHHVGFDIEDKFVIGFGMDVAQRYRELDHIAIYDEAIEKAHG